MRQIVPTIDFHARANRDSYATRRADPGWGDVMARIVDAHGARVLDVGCGGGIYLAAWRALGAAAVTGVDFSQTMLATARRRCAGDAGIALVRCEATALALPDASADVVYSRALLHHLPDTLAFVRELHRVAAPGATIVVQDRTAAQVRLPGSPTHLRGWLFQCHPRLLRVEDARRPRSSEVLGALAACGLRHARAQVFWEVKARHRELAVLAADIRARNGRSILHALDDGELERYVEFLARRLPADAPIVEVDPWTLWIAQR